jgi:hypothetical protein
MRTRIHTFGGAASVALLGALLAVAPSAAQQSALSEQDFATRALNAQAASEAAAAARVDAAERHDRVQGYQKDLREHGQALERHEAAQEAQTEAYQRELEAYAEEKDRQARVYQEVLANLDDKRFAILTYPGQRLSELSHRSDDELIGAKVQDRDGKVVGEVARVDIPRVAVKLNTGATVTVRSPRLRYDLDTRAVIADVKVSDLEKMPRATF